jgi:putative ABC transport system permease protein
MKNLVWAFKNLFRNLKRTLVTSLALIFGFVGLVLIGGYIYRVERFIYTQTIYTNQSGHLTITKKGGFEGFSQTPNKFILSNHTVSELESYLKKLEEVSFVGKKITGVGLVSSGEVSIPFIAEGYDEEERKFICVHPLVRKWNNEYIDPGCEIDFQKNEITITSNLARSLQLKGEEKSLELVARTFDGYLNGTSANLKAFHSTGHVFIEDNSLRASNEVLKELYHTSGFWRLQVYLKKVSELDKVKAKISSKFPNLEVLTFKENGNDSLYKGMISFLFVMGVFFLFLILGTVILALVNSITITILERSKELGTLRSIGFSSEQISKVLAIEALLIGIVSSFLGIIISYFVSFFVNSMNFRLRPINTPRDIQFVISPTGGLILFLVSLFIVLTYWVSLWVCKKTLKNKIIELLNDSGSRK